MYTLIHNSKKNPRLHELWYKTPCGRKYKMVSVIDKGTKDERYIFHAEIVVKNTVLELMKVLEA